MIARKIWIEAINLQTRKLPKFKLLEVYSKELGYLKLSGSRLGGRSEPLVHNLYFIDFDEHKDIHPIRQSEFQRGFRALQDKLEKLLHALSYLSFARLCQNTHDENSRQIFALLLASLQQLETNQQTHDVSLSFLWSFAELAGYQITLSRSEKIQRKKHNVQELHKLFSHLQSTGSLAETDFSVQSKRRAVITLQNYLQKQFDVQIKSLSVLHDLEQVS